MISLTLFVCLSVCLSTIYLSIYRFIYLSILSQSVRLCLLRQIITLHRSNFDMNTSVASSLHLSLRFYFFSFWFFLFHFLLCRSFFSCYVLSFPFLSFSYSFSFSTYLSPFCVETVTLLKPKRWSFYSSQCSSRFNFYSTVVLSLIKIPTKNAK